VLGQEFAQTFLSDESGCASGKEERTNPLVCPENSVLAAPLPENFESRFLASIKNWILKSRRFLSTPSGVEKNKLPERIDWMHSIVMKSPFCYSSKIFQFPSRIIKRSVTFE
jgi:hypothetical protein